MTPAARIQAAIEILDTIQEGAPAEQALTRWARGSRYAGSGDRAAVRDHVFSALRCLRSFAVLGGDTTGRGLMIGALKSQEKNLDEMFTGTAYAPAVLTDEEVAKGSAPKDICDRLDMPDWLWPLFQNSLGEQAEVTARALQHRAPVHLRVNVKKTDVSAALTSLRDDGVTCDLHLTVETALTVNNGSRRVRQSSAYQSGSIEIQDAASQAVVNVLPLSDGMRVLDYCAGGGGKALAMVAQAKLEVFAHDLYPDRMRDLPARAERAEEKITELTTDSVAENAPFDLVLCDSPCSGSGSWRRSPDAKWNLTQEKLNEFMQIQSDILEAAAKLASTNGVLVYVTCSVLNEENVDSVNRFLSSNSGWKIAFQKSWPVSETTDGFYTAHLTRDI